MGTKFISTMAKPTADKYAIRYDYSDGSGRANRAVVTGVIRTSP